MAEQFTELYNKTLVLSFSKETFHINTIKLNICTETFLGFNYAEIKITFSCIRSMISYALGYFHEEKLHQPFG